jgi:hypothetical protein
MFIKEGYAREGAIHMLSREEAQVELASPEIVSRLEKHARRVQALAPKSDDFLYFTIIFLKSAEASLIDENGDLKKVGTEKAWGYFDDEWKWHGNAKPHKNNNGDIFPEAELKVAARKWIGMPLCVDHKSDSVDGVRGIILDTYYDERLKQVVGLCALDRVNYPDLARKVATGVVRYGSMGTAVETSVCTECANKAKSPNEYCPHIRKRSAWGEINVGLRPIEYSLVVQPAEPGAKLLRCIASIREHGSELKNYGVDDIEDFTSSLNLKQAEDLDRILHSVCGENGCSLNVRKGIVTAYLDHNGFRKAAALNEAQEEQVQFAEALAEVRKATGKSPEDAANGDQEAYELYAPIYRAFGRSMSTPTGGAITSGQGIDSEPVKTIMSPKDSNDTPDYTGTGGDTSLMAGTTEPSESFGETGGVGPESYAFASDKINFDSIMGDLMKESRLRKRAEIRRRLAYHQGGADGVEPQGTYKSETTNEDLREGKGGKGDKQMFPNPANLGGTDGMVPGDKETKEKLSRAELEARRQKIAYHQGGAAPAVEPSTYKSEDYKKYWESDKQMHLNPASTGGTDGMFPGDKEKKEQLKRASLEGVPMSTRLTQVKKVDGTINKSASKFEVFAGEKLVIATTAGTVWGETLEDNWDYMTSQEYGKDVVAEIRESGLEVVANLLTKNVKVAQELPAPEPAPEAAPEMPPMDAPEMDEMPGEEAGEDKDPKSAIEEAFMAMEEKMDEVRDALDRLGGEDVDVNINVGGEEDAEKLALSQTVYKNLKTVLGEINECADELALLSQTHENYSKFSSKQKADFDKLASDALRDSAELVGESSALISVAKVAADALVKTSSTYTEEKVAEASEEAKAPAAETKVAEQKSEEDQLIAQAKLLRKQRREELLRKAAEKLEQKTAELDQHYMDDKKLDDMGTHTGHGMASEHMADDGSHAKDEHHAKDEDHAKDHKEDHAEDHAKDHAESEAKDHGEHEHKAEDHSEAEHPAADMEHEAKDKDMKDVAEKEAKEEVEEHEEEMHDKDDESKAMDGVQAKLQESFVEKKAEEERTAYKLKVRRAYDVAMMMQSKGLLPKSKAALERQVDEILHFNDEAFEAFKRSVAYAKPPEMTRTASDLGGINIGVDEDASKAPTNLAEALNTLWE